MLNLPVDWSSLWLGGFCPVGALGGLPVRGADYAAHPPLDKVLTTPALHNPQVTLTQVEQAWSRCLGDVPVLLMRDAYHARRLVHQAAGIVRGTAVGVPANATGDLAESVKHQRAQPRFLDLGPCLELQLTDVVSYRWSQPIGGLWTADAETWHDYSDTLPLPRGVAQRPAVAVYGLHLAPPTVGALLVFGDVALYTRALALRTAADLPNLAQAAYQCERLMALATAQQARLAEVQRGLHEAAGLVTLAPSQAALAQGIAVQIPPEADIATFYAYVQQENTPVRWLPQIQPLHYAAVRAEGVPHPHQTAAHLARWLYVPVGPAYTFEEIKHGVLGIVKAAEYLGVRWRTNPAYAAEYAALMNQTYGAGHDAYRPLFALSEV